MTPVLLIAIPIAGGLFAWFVGRWGEQWPRWTALAVSASGFGLALSIWVKHFAGETSPGTGRWLERVDVAWIPSAGIRFHLAIDGLSLIMLMLTFALTALAVAASWKGIRRRVGFFHFHLMWAAAGLAGVFMALDLLLFYFFFELMLVPLYFLIALWGHERGVKAAYKFFIYTQASGLLMLVAILGLYFVHGRGSGLYTFDYLQLLGTTLSPRTGLWLMLGFFAAFAVKLPAVPLHSWLPAAHAEAPTAGSVILAGLLIKVGAYGMLRFMIPLFPQASLRMTDIGMALAVVGILYGAVMAFAQTDLKRLVAYTSISHMGFVLLGIFAWNETALQGVMLQIICHAFSTGGLFILAGALEERLGTRDLAKMGGLWSQLPRFGGVTMFLAMAALGLPGLGNFVAEFLILLGAYKVSPPAAILAAVGLVTATVYALWLVQRVFHGTGPRALNTAEARKGSDASGKSAADGPDSARPGAGGLGKTGRPRVKHGERFTDLSGREIAMMAVAILVILWLGLYPQTLIRTVKHGADFLLEQRLPPAAAETVTEVPGENGAAGKEPSSGESTGQGDRQDGGIAGGGGP